MFLSPGVRTEAAISLTKSGPANSQCAHVLDTYYIKDFWTILGLQSPKN